jgi:hypothetical protein
MALLWQPLHPNAARVHDHRRYQRFSEHSQEHTERMNNRRPCQGTRRRGTTHYHMAKSTPSRGRVYAFTDALPTLYDALWIEHQSMKKKAHICRFVFHSRGKRIKTFKKAWKTACERAGYPGCIL